ncbi:MAG TPA: hypothetical protein VM425_07655 [Myxococcota bacterium]|nr:hypothetical protein [Myxococcota bacterium]
MTGFTKCGFLLASFAFSACAHVESVERIEDKPVRTYIKTSKPKGQKKYIAICKNEPAAYLRCTIETEDRCNQENIKVVNRTVIAEKSTSTWSKILEWSASGILLGAGGIVTVNAGYLPEK